MFTAGRRLPIAPLLPTLLALAAAACAAGGQSGAPPDATTAAPVRPPAATTAMIEWLRPAPLPGVSSSPAAGPGPAAAPRERVAIDLGGLWVGPENPHDGPRAHYLFARRQRAEDLAQLVRDYAPFRVIGQGDGAGSGGVAGGSVGGGRGAAELIFRGRGAAQASAAERRMIEEWTRTAEIEAVGMVEAAAASPAVSDVGAPSPVGLAFAWHRGAASGGVCDDLVVYLTGEVRAGSCGVGSDVGGRLAAERLQRLYTWIDGFAAFQAAGEQELRAGALLDRLIFAGRGRQRATPGDIAAIEAFAGSLHRELTAAATAAPAVAASAVQRPPAAARKAASPPAEPPEDAAPEDEAAAASAETVPALRPRPRQMDVTPEPDEAPPPPPPPAA